MNLCMLRAALSESELDCHIDIEKVHRGLGIEFIHFERFLMNFFCVLRTFEVDDEDI